MNPATILIVEDEAILARELKMILMGEGYKVQKPVPSFEKAVESLQKELPDLVILDINLKGKHSGIDLGSYLREILKVPFIYLTANYDAQTWLAANATDPYAFLTKPYREEELFFSIKTALTQFAQSLVSQEDSDHLLVKDALFVRKKYTYYKVLYSDICWLKGEGHYTHLETNSDQFLVRISLKNFVSITSHAQMFRLHRSYIINVDKVDEIRPSAVVIKNQEIPVPREKRESLLAQLETYH